MVLETIKNEWNGNDAGDWVESCMICTKEISVTENFSHSPKVALILSNLFKVLCKYMKWKAPSNYLFDFKTDSFPFCKKCKISLVRLYKLNQRLQGIQGKINQMVVRISGAILESQNASLEKINMTKASETEEKWSYYRNLTHKRFRPRVHIGSLSLEPEVHISEAKRVYLDSSRTVSVVEDSFNEEEEFQLGDVSEEELLINELTLGAHPSTSGELQEEIGLTSGSYFPPPIFNNPSDIFHDTLEGEQPTVFAINQWSCEGDDNPEAASFINTKLEADEALPLVTTYVPGSLVRYLGQPESETLMRNDECQNPFSCEFCGRTFSKKRNLVRHTKRIHSVKPRIDDFKFVCETCGQHCCNQFSLIRHYLTHTNDRPFRCELCDQYFKSTENLKKHKSRVHPCLPVRSAKQFSCNVCGQKFECLQHLTVHKTWHEKVTCKECGQSVRKTLFKVHMLCHRKDKQYRCDKCNESFKSSRDLTRHERSHRRVLYSHVCDICGKNFSQQYILLRHKTRSHGSEEVHIRFPCKICGYEFSQKYNLSRHEFNVHKLEKPGFQQKKRASVYRYRNKAVTCDICGDLFSSKFSLLRHKDKVHNSAQDLKITAD